MTKVCCCKKRNGSTLILTIINAIDNSVLSTLEGIYTQDNILIVLNVYTLEDHRRKGYGTMLLKRVIWEAQRNKNHYRIELDNFTDGTNDFYEKNGFAYVSTGFPEMYLTGSQRV